jgi:carbon-monoxide dehydrogenase large subunit
LLTDTQARDHLSHAELALDAEGRILALRCATHGNMGGYASPFATSSPVVGFPRTLVNVYRIPALHVIARAAYTHTTPTDAFRGAGKPEAVHLMERLLDAAAAQTGIDRMSLRQVNLVTSREMPYQAANGEVWDCGDFPRAMTTALREADWDTFDARRQSSLDRGRLRGFGLGLYLHTAGAATTETSRIQVAADGRVFAFLGQQAIGQGHETTFALLIGDHLGVDPRRVVVVEGDSERLTHQGAATGGSASLQCAGTTLLRAADAVVEQLRSHAAQAMEVSATDLTYESGFYSVKGTDLQVGLLEVGARVSETAPGDCSAEADFEGNVVTIPNGAYVCEVEVDPETGSVDLRRFVAVDDVGRRIHPVIVDGQLHGGIAHGLGQAWMEHVRYDPETGQAVSGSLMDYAVPRADHLPSFELHAADVATRNNDIGAKGAGELGCLGAPAAFMNAVADAIGTQDIEMPATPERVWRALCRSGQRPRMPLQRVSSPT